MNKSTIYENVKQYLEENPNPTEDIYRVTDTKIHPDDVWALVSCALDRWYTESSRASEFRNKIKVATNTRYSILVNSGSSANLLAVTAAKDHFKSPDGGKVITCATAFPTTVAPILQNNLIPLFIDIVPETLAYDTQLILDLLDREDVVGAVLTHNLGFPYESNVISSKCKIKNKWLIEDCCDALGSRIYGKPVGSFGDLSTLSFFPAHHITTGEGGAVQTNNSKLYRLLQQYSNWGRDCWCEPGQNNTCNQRFSHTWDSGLPDGYDHKYTFTKVGYNLKMTDLQAALGSSQIDRLPQIVMQRQWNYNKVFDITSFYLGLDIIDLPDEASPFGFPIATSNRKKLVDFLESKNIITRPVFSGNILKHPMMKDQEYEVSEDGLFGANYVMDNMFWVGVHPFVTDGHMKKLQNALDEYYHVKEKRILDS